jgi:hypothetical protein
MKLRNFDYLGKHLIFVYGGSSLRVVLLHPEQAQLAQVFLRDGQAKHLALLLVLNVEGLPCLTSVFRRTNN